MGNCRYYRQRKGPARLHRAMSCIGQPSAYGCRGTCIDRSRTRAQAIAQKTLIAAQDSHHCNPGCFARQHGSNSEYQSRCSWSTATCAELAATRFGHVLNISCLVFSAMNPGGGTPGLWILQEDMFMFSFCYFHFPRYYFSLIIELGFHLITTIIYL